MPDIKHLAVMAAGVIAGLYVWRSFVKPSAGAIAGSKSNL